MKEIEVDRDLNVSRSTTKLCFSRGIELYIKGVVRELPEIRGESLSGFC